MLIRLDGNYVMMSNFFVEVGHWKDYQRIREMVKRKGLKKEVGHSWVEIDKEIHFSIMEKTFIHLQT